MRPDVVVRTLTARGLLGLELPHRRARQLLALQRWGYGIAGELRAAAAVSGSRVALIDERGAHTYSEAVDLGDRLARVLRSRGLPAGARVGLLAPNGVEFVLALYAANLLGIDVVLLNTGLTGERITQIADRDDLQTVLHDGELAHLVGGVAAAYDLGELMTQARDAAYGPSGGRLAPAREEGRTIVLTSGTTGVPKGAPRRAVGGIGAIVSILERIPLHHRDRILLSAPLFHTWGFAGLQLAFGVQATVILQRRFEPARAQAALAEHRAQVLFAVPAMLQRLLAWREAVPEAGLPHLRVVASSGSKF
ncbi:MAG TPA: AMP-binding protein, partial [Tetrasphaera sp.]|nr:AMP-binding protein [Tetrasphaera sp.]